MNMHVYIYEHICVCVYKFICIYLHIYTHTCDLPSPDFTLQKFSEVICTVIQYLVNLVTNRLWTFLRDDRWGLRLRALILRHASVKSPIYPQKRPTYCICESAETPIFEGPPIFEGRPLGVATAGFIYPQKRPTYCICESAEKSDSYFWRASYFLRASYIWRATVGGRYGRLWLWGMLLPRIWRQHDTLPLLFRLAASFARFLVLQTP